MNHVPQQIGTAESAPLALCKMVSRHIK